MLKNSGHRLRNNKHRLALDKLEICKGCGGFLQCFKNFGHRLLNNTHRLALDCWRFARGFVGLLKYLINLGRRWLNNARRLAIYGPRDLLEGLSVFFYNYLKTLAIDGLTIHIALH